MNEFPRDWWKKTVAYEVYPMSFMDANGDGLGDLKGLTSRLDYLKSLGVGALWITPVYLSPMVDNGYDVSDFRKINPMFGTMDDMDSLIAEADKRGIKIVMDLVFNHTSNKCDWFLESCKDRVNSKNDWYIWRDPRNGGVPNNWRSIFGGSVWEWCESRKQYYMHTFAKEQPDLNWENTDVRNSLYDIAEFWIQKGVGGFRMDAIPYIKKPVCMADGLPDAGDGLASVHTMTVNTNGILDFLHEFKDKVISKHPGVFTVAEANGVKPDDLKHWVGSDGAFDMLFEFSHLHDVELWCKPSPFTIMDFKKALVESQKATASNGWYPIFFENHDRSRCVDNYFYDALKGASAQMRTFAATAIAVLLFTLRGTPFVYQGQEIGMANVAWDDIDSYNEVNSKAQYRFALEQGFGKKDALEMVHRYSRDNARTPMQWDESLNAGFTQGRPWLGIHSNYLYVNVSAQEEDPGSVLNGYRYLSNLRRTSTELLEGDFIPVFEEHGQILAYRRSGYLILVNLSAAEAVYDPGVECGSDLICSNYDVWGQKPSKDPMGRLRPFEAVIFYKKV